jgi:uncharacterized protein
MPRVLIDTGPLTALLNPREEHHEWTLEASRRFEYPLFTSEAVLAESAHLLTRRGGSTDGLFALKTRSMIEIGIQFENEWESIRRLMTKYRNVPMSLADASLVCLSELNPDCAVFTLDSDFRIYRRHGNKPIPLLIPN